MSVSAPEAMLMISSQLLPVVDYAFCTCAAHRGYARFAFWWPSLRRDFRNVRQALLAHFILLGQAAPQVLKFQCQILRKEPGRRSSQSTWNAIDALMSAPSLTRISLSAMLLGTAHGFLVRSNYSSGGSKRCQRHTYGMNSKNRSCCFMLSCE